MSRKKEPNSKFAQKPAAPSDPAPNDSAVLPPPVTLSDHILLEIRKFIAASIFFNTQAADKIGLGLTDMQLIHILALYGASTPTRMSALSGLSSGGITVALDRLEKAGYVRRQPNPTDRRSLLVTLLPTRLRKLGAMYEGIEAGTRRQLATLPEKDLEAVLRFFTALQSVR